MIRPFTIVCMVLAGASGLYLYRSKHQAQMLDREITRTVRQNDATKERISMLRAEWALLNEPDRLSELAKAHTNLRSLSPSQFVAAADFASKLPAPVAPGTLPSVLDDPDEPSTAPPSGPVVAQAAPPSAPRPAPSSRPVSAAASSEAHTTAPKPAPKPTQVQVATVSGGSMAGAAPRQVLPAGVNSSAVAPGTIGEAVLRAMRAHTLPAPAPAPAPAPSYAAPRVAAVPTPVVSYAPRVAVAPTPVVSPVVSYAPPQATSLLGSARTSLPPPVPYAAR